MALRCLGRQGEVRDLTFGELEALTNRFANVLAVFPVYALGGDRTGGFVLRRWAVRSRQVPAGAFVRSLPEDIQEGIAAHGLRNSQLTAIAPTGTISLLAGNISSGLEPIFDLRFRRRVLAADGTWQSFELTDPALVLWHEIHPGAEPPPGLFVTARELPPSAHLDMQVSLQPFVDNAISKTINVPADLSFTAFRSIYEEAWRKGLKGVTTFRANPVPGDILAALPPSPADLHCCTIEREAD